LQVIQAEQLEEPLVAAKVPAEQTSHVAVPPAEALPRAQSRHVAFAVALPAA
jgi:hypothetical protein